MIELNFLFYSRLPVPKAVSYQGNSLMKRLFPKGFSMNFVLITWALCGGLFLYAFLANFRTVLLMPQYEKPVDSAQDILDRGLIPILDTPFDIYHLLHSPNSAYQKLGEIGVSFDNFDEYWKMVSEDIQGANTHVSLTILYGYDRELFGPFHESKEVLEGKNPFAGDIVNKKWSFAEEYSCHLLIFHQVENPIRIRKKDYCINCALSHCEIIFVSLFLVLAPYILYELFCSGWPNVPSR